ncbi:MAG TPA: pyrroline-5-carboxylate reductase [Anaerovoracaceae bacterium]|nr:pyrroline-5-carboxylate reductase [Anaerovoracaceae bacterium]
MIYGFLGTGKMSSAIITGMIKGGYNPENILGYNRSNNTIDNLCNEYGIIKCKSQKELIDGSDIVILGVKPNVLDNIKESLSKDLKSNNPLIISLAVGKTIDYLEKSLGENNRIVRLMPNINSITLASTTGYSANKNVSSDDISLMEKAFGTIGTIESIPEKQFHIFSAIAGSSPAFSYMYINALATAAVKAGMPKDKALKIAASSVLGSAKTVLETGANPYELIDSVCSPGGTTIEGVASLKSSSLESTVINAVDKVLEKDAFISKGEK